MAMSASTPIVVAVDGGGGALEGAHPADGVVDDRGVPGERLQPGGPVAAVGHDGGHTGVGGQAGPGGGVEVGGEAGEGGLVGLHPRSRPGPSPARTGPSATPGRSTTMVDDRDPIRATCPGSAGSHPGHERAEDRPTGAAAWSQAPVHDDELRPARARILPPAPFRARISGMDGPASDGNAVLMKYGVSMFPTRYSIGPADLARAVEERGFESLFFPEHTHIPTSRRSPWPGGGRPPGGVPGDARPVPGPHRRRRRPPTDCCSGPASASSSSGTRSPRPRRWPPSTSSPAAVSSSAWAGAGTGRRWRTTAPTRPPASPSCGSGSWP